MRTNIEPLSWQANLSDFGKRNKMRPTRVEVLGRTREMDSDYWLEDGLLFAGITLEMDVERGPSVEIMLQVPAAPTRDHMTHTVIGVNRVELKSDDFRI